jgi:hypothetical protein
MVADYLTKALQGAEILLFQGSNHGECLSRCLDKVVQWLLEHR